MAEEDRVLVCCYRRPVLSLTFAHLDDTEFEEFAFDLLDALGFVNIEWRKGTGLKSSPADQGRDIEADWLRVDVDDAQHLDRWFVDCKHHERGVPPEKLQNLLTWAEAESPRVALIVTSGFLSNPARNYLKTYEANRRPPFEMKVWDRKKLERLIQPHDSVLDKWGVLGSSLRNEDEISVAEQEFYDRVWYGRHAGSIERYERILTGALDDGRTTPEIAASALTAGQAMREKYGGDEKLLPADDFEWGMMSGKLSALRWVLGEEWDMLDT